MVQAKKPNDMSNGTTKYRDQQSSMSFQRKDITAGGAGKNDGRSQNGNANSFRTDGAISGARSQGEGRTLQKWQPDGPAEIDGSLESSSMRSSGGAVWDQFAENERRFGIKTDYDENIYTTTIDKSHPQYKQRVAEAEKKAKEIINKSAFNSHVAEERVQDNVGGDGIDEEDKYSGVRRKQDFPPLTSTNSGNKYTPPARRPPTGQATVKGAPVDPAIISSQLSRPEKLATEKSKASPTPATIKPEVSTPSTTAASSFTTATPETKATPSNTPSFTSRTASPNVRPEGAPNATATVEKDVTVAFKNFATQQRKNVDQLRSAKAKNDKEIKLNDLKKFADSFKLHTPVPSDLVSIITKDPAKQKEIQEKAKRNAEEAKANPSEAVKPIAAAAPDARPATRPAPATHGASPSNVANRQNTNRNQGFAHQGQYNPQSFRADRPQSQQPIPTQQNRQQPGQLAGRLRSIEQTKQNQQVMNPVPIQETRLPPTGPSNLVDPNFSRRSSGVASTQGARLNPNSSEFRPSPHAATFNPNGNPSSGSSPRSATTLVDQPTLPVKRSLLRRTPIPDSERPLIKEKFNALDFIKSLKPAGKNWDATGGIKPAYDTAPAWRSAADDEPPNSTMLLTYAKVFDMTPFPTQTMSPPNPAHAVPQVAHQHQLPFHLQHGVHAMASRQSPRQPQMNLHGNQHGHGPNPPFNGADDHRMMPSHSAQSYASPRLQSLPMAAFQSPMGQPAQMAYNPQMIPYPGGGAPPMQQQYRSLSQTHQFVPQPQMAPIMMQNPANGFMTSQGMAPGPHMMYQPGQAQFMPPGNGPPNMPVNGYPSPGRNAAPMMMSQGSQQGLQQQPMYGMNPGMSPGPQYGNVTATPIYAQQGPQQMPMRGYNGPNQFGTSPQQMHQFGPQRNNHPNGNYNKNFQQHGQQGPPNNQIPTGPQSRAEGGDESK